MSEDIIPPNPENSENSDSQIPDNQNFISSIRGNSGSEAWVSLYTISDMISLWYHAMIAGGNAKQYTIDSSITPEKHIQIIDGILSDIKASANPEQAIKLLLSNNMVLLGNIYEIMGKL